MAESTPDPSEMTDDIATASRVGKNNGGIELSSWEESFVDSIQEQIDRGRTLSEKQLETLKGIWDRI